MSHFTGIVIGSNVEGQLAKYDENLDTPEYLKFTKEQVIAKERAEVADYRDNGLYADYLRDPAAYAADARSSSDHLQYITVEFPNVLARFHDDEFMYQRAIRFYEPGDLNEDGGILSTYNPDSQWDWYVVGGRWANMLITKTGDQVNECEVGQLDIEATWPGDYTVRVLVQDGEWKQIGEMGWFGISREDMEQEKWNTIVKDTLRKLAKDAPDTWVTLIDFHI